MATSEIEALLPQLSSRLTDTELAQLYAYPSPQPADPWVRANFVASLDGAACVDGRSAQLSGHADRRVFLLLRALADVVLVGAGTVRVEGYGNTQDDVSSHMELRGQQRLSPVPPVAVVTRSADLDPASPLLTENVVPPIVLTTLAAPERRRAALIEAGADVVIAGDQDVSPYRLLGELSRRGLNRVLCEGGPTLLTSMLAAGAVDELCLTLAPTMVAGHSARIAQDGPLSAPVSMTLESVLRGLDGLLLRYRRTEA